MRGYLTARGISCGRARNVFRAVEHAYEKDRLPRSVYATPYFHWSSAFTVPTAYGPFSCRYSPHGLAGSEHTMRCRHKAARVSWYTLHSCRRSRGVVKLGGIPAVEVGPRGWARGAGGSGALGGGG